MAQLEALRQQALGGALPASRNGHDTIQRSVRLDLSREQLQRAQRLSLQLIVEDGERHAIEAPLDLAVDLEPRPSLEEVLLRLQIQVSGR